MNRLGIMVRDLGASELNWRLVKQLKEIPVDPLFFYEVPVKAVFPPPGSVMQVSEAWGYTGPVIATTLSTAKKLAGFPSPSAKVFYVWDLEWLRMSERHFYALRAVYANPKLKLICRTAEHARLIEDLWGPVAGVVEKANLKEILELICGTELRISPGALLEPGQIPSHDCP